MRRELLIAAGPGEYRAALLEDGTIAELYVERGNTMPPGSIVLGRVVHRAAGLDSAFVDIGEARPGIVPLREAANAGIALHEGARVTSQVRREAVPGKGARLSTRLMLRGIDPAALSARAAALDPPTPLDPAHGLAGALSLRLPAMPAQIVVDDIAAVPELRAAFPEAATRFLDPAEWPLDLDAAIEAALTPVVDLGGGARLHIEETETAVLIDVDTGTPEQGDAARSALAANLAAAAAIARQIRLRQLGGGIVIDFVGVEGRNARDRVRAALAAALATDPAQPQVLGWTRLGHLEIVRPRRARSLAAAMLEPGGGARPRHAVALAHDALRALRHQARATPAATWTIVTTPAVAAALHGSAGAARHALETRLGRPIAVETAEVPPPRAFDIVTR